MAQVSIPVSVGELIDKITILEIKSERIHDAAKLENVRRELRLLSEAWSASQASAHDIAEHRGALKAVNESLWDIEDEIRRKEAARDFDDSFVRLARSVYVSNDERAAIKRRINEQCGSELFEEKSYVDYSA